tara:strand:+ start:814 stop:1047 length:234 start_codon:yes stop_codon:yes gene_type:complete
LNHTKYNIKKLIHAFFVIKKEEHYVFNRQILDDFKRKPGLYHISKKRGIEVGQVYNIVKTHDINVLNTNIIKLMEIK